MSGTTTKPMATTTNAATTTQPRVSPVPALGPERPVAWPKRTVRTLPNGMQVVLAELRTFPENFRAAFFPQRQRQRRSPRAGPR